MFDNEARQAVEVLIRDLESAAGGSAALDQRIEHCLGTFLALKANLTELLVSEGVAWPTITETLRGHTPRYTASLDAAIPGEDILFVMRSAARGKWAAVQRAFGGREVLAWGATEPLARRLAALKTHAIAMTAAEAPAPNRTVPRAAEPQPKREDTPETVDWKVRF